MNAFSAAIDLLFADPNLARDAAYASAHGDTLPVRIIARRPDSVTDFADARLWSETASFNVRVSEVALPRPGDRLILDGEIFVIQGEPIRDAERLVWTIGGCATTARRRCDHVERLRAALLCKR